MTTTQDFSTLSDDALVAAWDQAAQAAADAREQAKALGREVERRQVGPYAPPPAADPDTPPQSVGPDSEAGA